MSLGTGAGSGGGGGSGGRIIVDLNSTLRLKD